MAKEWTEQEIAEYLSNLIESDQLEDHGDDHADYAPDVRGQQTFADAGVLTSDTGIVLRLAGGKSAFITVQVQKMRW